MPVKNKQEGFSLIITLFIMVIILSVVLSVSVLLYSEIKVIRNIGNSIAAFYAADSGVEKVLFYDRQVLPEGAKRGLCSIFDAGNNSEKYCRTDPNPQSLLDHSIYCNQQNIVAGSSNLDHGCDPDVCDDCTIYFETYFDERTYKVSAIISDINFDIKAKGDYREVERQIQISNEL